MIPVLADDRLALNVFSVVASPRVRLGVNVRYADGRPDKFTLEVVGDTDRSVATDDLIMPECEIHSATVHEHGTQVATQPGECFVHATLRRGNDRLFRPVMGYLYPAHQPSYPGRQMGSLEGPGRIFTQSLGDPAAGSDYTDEAVPTDAMWRVLGFQGQMVADANAASRRLRIDYSDGTRTIPAALSGTDQTANVTTNYYAGIGLAHQNRGSGDIVLPLPDIRLDEASVISPTTVSIQAGDDWAEGFLLVEEWMKLAA